MSHSRTNNCTRGVARFFTGKQEGQAIFLVVAFFLLLASLLFLIINTGDQLNTKVSMQNAADAATATGAAWYARGLNIISMCNATEAQIMSFILVLDTLEEIIPHAVQTIDDLMASLGSSAAGHDMPNHDPLSWLVVGEAQAEQEMVHKLNNIVEALPLAEYCSYDDGVLWQACILLDAFAEEMAEITPMMSQEQAIRVAKFNEAEFGFVVPIWPKLPVRDVEFEAFRLPMLAGKLPEPLNSSIGGFHSLFGYGGGPFNYYRSPFINPKPMGLFDMSRLSPMFRTVSDMKFAMLFGEADDMLSLGAWEMDYDTAVKIAEDAAEARRNGLEPEVEILATWWERTGFDSRKEFPTAAFYQSLDLRSPEHPQPSMSRSVGWHPAPADYTRASTPQEGADPRLAVFYKTSERKSVHYPALGIIAPHPPYHPDGTEWEYQPSDYLIYYHTDMRRFNGVELEIDTQLSRAYLPPAGSVPPLTPILLDRTAGDNTVAHKSERFTFMGFAYTSGGVSEWPTRFVNPNPNPKTVCFAQARVFNYVTWDLFTQAWLVKLMRVDRWNPVLQEIENGVPAGASVLGDQIDAGLMAPAAEMMRTYSTDFVQEVTH